jgi:hypothetical protein
MYPTSGVAKSRYPNPSKKAKKPKTSTPAKPKPLDKKNRRRYEMILAWFTSRQPMHTQKLMFDAGLAFKDGYQEAIAIRRLLISAGDFKNSDAKIIAVNVLGALERFQKEQGFYFQKQQKEIDAMVKAAKKLKLQAAKAPKKDDSRTIKTRG